MNDLDQALCHWEILTFDAGGSGFTSTCIPWIRVVSFFPLLWRVFSNSINMLEYYIVYPQSFSCSLKQLERAKLRKIFPLPNFFSLFFVPWFSLAHVYLIFLILHRLGCTNGCYFYMNCWASLAAHLLCLRGRFFFLKNKKFYWFSS